MSSNRSAVTVRLGGPDDDPAIAALLSRGAPGNPKSDLDVLRWQYRTEEFGPTTTVVAEHEGSLVGHYSAVAVPLTVDGRAVRAVRGVDIVTHPDHRGRGVFARVAEHLVETLRGQGVEVIVSTPNDNSLPALADRGWDPVGDPRVFALPVDGAALSRRSPLPLPPTAGRAAVGAFNLVRRGWSSVAGRSRAGSLAAEVEAALVPDLPADLDLLLTGEPSTTGISRSARWLQWRYLDHPNQRYHLFAARRGERLVGLAVVSMRDDAQGRFAQVLDLVATDGGATQAVVAAVAGHAGVEQAMAVVGAALAGTAHQRVLQQGGLVPVPRRLQPRPVHLLVADLAGTRPDLASRRWSFTLGDQDHL